jgi:hypothetical protein
VQLGIAGAAVGSVPALVATPDPVGQRVERSFALALLLTYSLLWASKPLPTSFALNLAKLTPAHEAKFASLIRTAVS